MKSFLRSLAATFVGLLVAFVCVIGVEFFSSVVHPFPSNFLGSQDEICRHVERYPAWVLAVVIPMWAITAFAGTWTAKRTGNVCAAVIVGVLVLAALVCNVAMLPYPMWFKVGCLLAIPASVIAAVIGRKKTELAKSPE